MSKAIFLRCHACRARIKAPIKLLGEIRSCPRCGQAVRIRIQPPEDCGPLIIRDRSEEDTNVIPGLAW